MDQISKQLAQLKLDRHAPQYIFIPVKKENIKLFFFEILTIKADGNFVNVNTTKGNFMVLSNLTQFTKQLPQQIFARVHKTWSVNLSKIDKYTKEHVVIKGEIIPLGTSHKKHILNLLNQISIQRQS